MLMWLCFFLPPCSQTRMRRVRFRKKASVVCTEKSFIIILQKDPCSTYQYGFLLKPNTVLLITLLPLHAKVLHVNSHSHDSQHRYRVSQCHDLGSSHLCRILTKPYAVLQCCWTNQPYQMFESWALSNYNLSGSQDADECEGITVQSHTRHWHSASDSSTRPPNPAPRISLRCRWSWFQTSPFVVRQWLMWRPQTLTSTLYLCWLRPRPHQS